METFSLLPCSDVVAKNGYAASLEECANFWDFGTTTFLVTKNLKNPNEDDTMHYIASSGVDDITIGVTFKSTHDQEMYYTGTHTVLNKVVYTDGVLVSKENTIGTEPDEIHPVSTFK